MLSFTTCQAAIAEPFCAALARYMSARLGIEVDFVHAVDWQVRKLRLKTNEIDAGWVCGLTYVQWMALPDPPVELLAAPVHRGARYAGRPVYFSDVVVRADSRYTSFADLRGARWAYNEPGSHSGCNITRLALARMGAHTGFFGSAVQSGAHQRSLEMILSGEIDASAIDSMVLEGVLHRQPELSTQIRIIDSLGPSPAPPWVVARTLDPGLRAEVRAALCDMHTDPQGKPVLIAGQLERFAPVTDADYEPTRAMAREAETVTL